MNGSLSRRQAVCGAGAMLGMNLVGLSLSTSAQANTSLLVPGVRMSLSRMVERELKDANKLVVSRSWDIRFSPSGQGFAVTGQQTSVAVDVPERLASIAEIERSRSTDQMFPIMLSDAGIIVAVGEDFSSADVSDAIDEAEGILRIGDMPTDRAGATHAMLMEIAQASTRMIEVLPADLFFPRQPLFEARRPLSVAGNGSGEFLLRYETRADPQTGLLQRAERQITTILGAQRRHSREIWTLA